MTSSHCSGLGNGVGLTSAGVCLSACGQSLTMLITSPSEESESVFIPVSLMLSFCSASALSTLSGSPLKGTHWISFLWTLQFSRFLADHCVDVVMYFRDLRCFLLPLILDLVSAFGSIPQQYSLASADEIQSDMLIEMHLPFCCFIVHPSSCLSVCEI